MIAYYVHVTLHIIKDYRYQLLNAHLSLKVWKNVRNTQLKSGH